jgi:ubiquinol-cytochrome c reductase cytochrome b subunit
MAKAGGFFFIVFGVTALLGAVASINPIWLYGPYTPGQISAGSQPDWYMGWLDGLVRMAPPLEPVIFGYTLSLNILIPGLIIPGILFTGMALYHLLNSGSLAISANIIFLIAHATRQTAQHLVRWLLPLC